MSLLPVQTWFQPEPGPLLPQLRRHLAAIAMGRTGSGALPLRWAITAAEPERGLRIEAVLLIEAQSASAAPVTSGTGPVAWGHGSGSAPLQADPARSAVPPPATIQAAAAAPHPC